MITLAMMYDVDTHAISSSVAPSVPIMCGMATFTIDVSTNSNTAANVTAMAIKYRCLYGSSATAAVFDDNHRREFRCNGRHDVTSPRALSLPSSR